MLMGPLGTNCLTGSVEHNPSRDFGF